MYSVSNAPRMQLTDVAEIPLQASYAKQWCGSHLQGWTAENASRWLSDREGCQAALAEMERQGGCSIISISPIAGLLLIHMHPQGLTYFAHKVNTGRLCSVKTSAWKGSNSGGMYGYKMKRPLHACLF